MDPQPWTASNKLLYDAKTSKHMRIRLNECCNWERVGKRILLRGCGIVFSTIGTGRYRVQKII